MEVKNYKTLLEEFKHLLKQNGLKFTNQRETVLKTLYQTSCHFTPEELHQLVKKEFPNVNVGIATIYRTLNLLENSDIVTSLTFGVNGKKYELNNSKHHDHMICDSCGKIIEFYDQEIEKKQAFIAKKHGFKLNHHIMQLHGICKECQKQSKDNH